MITGEMGLENASHRVLFGGSAGHVAAGCSGFLFVGTPFELRRVSCGRGWAVVGDVAADPASHPMSEQGRAAVAMMETEDTSGGQWIVGLMEETGATSTCSACASRGDDWIGAGDVAADPAPHSMSEEGGAAVATMETKDTSGGQWIVGLMEGTGPTST